MASDNFSATNNPLASPWATPGGSPAWNALQSASGECRTGSGSDGDCAMRYSTSSSLRSIVEYRSGTFDGGPAHMNAAGSGYLATCFTGTTVQIFRVTAGTNYAQQGGDGAVTFAAGDLAELRIDGNDIVFYKNAVETFRVTDATFRSLNPAIFIFDGTLRLDNWSDGAVGDAGQTITRPGPGIGPDRNRIFVPMQFGHSRPNDTSLAAALASQSTVTAEMTSMWLAAVTRPGPGISPDYLTMFTARGKGAVMQAVNDTSLTAALACVSTLTGALTTAIPLSVSLQSVSSVSASLTTQIRLQAAVTALSSLTAALTTAIPLQSALASSSTVTAALTTAIRLQATLAALSTLTATLDGGAAALAAVLGSSSSVTAALTTAIRLQAGLASSSSVTAALTTQIRLQSVIASLSTVTAALTTAIPLAASLGCQSAVTAALTSAIRFAASLASQSSLLATLTNGPTSPLAAALASQSNLIAGLTTAIRLQASLASLSTVTGTLTGGAATLAAVLQSVSTVLAELTDTVRAQPFGAAIWDPREGQFASRRNPYVSMLAPHDGRLVVGPDPVVVARFAWADNDGLVRTIRTGDQRLGWVRQVFGPWRSIYADRGLRWIRSGLPITLYVQGEFWARFPGGAQVGDTVYVSLIDGGPLSGYAANALPTQWRVATSAFPEELAIITTWE